MYCNMSHHITYDLYDYAYQTCNAHVIMARIYVQWEIAWSWFKVMSILFLQLLSKKIEAPQFHRLELIALGSDGNFIEADVIEAHEEIIKFQNQTHGQLALLCSQ